MSFDATLTDTALASFNVEEFRTEYNLLRASCLILIDDAPLENGIISTDNCPQNTIERINNYAVLSYNRLLLLQNHPDLSLVLSWELSSLFPLSSSGVNVCSGTLLLPQHSDLSINSCVNENSKIILNNFEGGVSFVESLEENNPCKQRILFSGSGEVVVGEKNILFSRTDLPINFNGRMLLCLNEQNKIEEVALIPGDSDSFLSYENLRVTSREENKDIIKVCPREQNKDCYQRAGEKFVVWYYTKNGEEYAQVKGDGERITNNGDSLEYEFSSPAQNSFSVLGKNEIVINEENIGLQRIYNLLSGERSRNKIILRENQILASIDEIKDSNPFISDGLIGGEILSIPAVLNGRIYLEFSGPKFADYKNIFPYINEKQIEYLEEIEYRAKIVGRMARNNWDMQISWHPIADIIPPQDIIDPSINWNANQVTGSDPLVAAPITYSIVTGFQRGGMIAATKHFPGIGFYPGNTHYDLGIIERTKGEINGNEIIPFKAAIDAGTKMIMVGHIAYTAFNPDDPKPATLSKEIMNDYLRGELGFIGVTITDELVFMDPPEIYFQRHGINDRWGEQRVYASMKAGADVVMLFTGPTETAPMVERQIAFVKDKVLVGEYPIEEIDASLGRILNLKYEIFGDKLFRSYPDVNSVEELISRLTLEEKIGQKILISTAGVDDQNVGQLQSLNLFGLHGSGSEHISYLKQNAKIPILVGFEIYLGIDGIPQNENPQIGINGLPNTGTYQFVNMGRRFRELGEET